VTGGGGLGVFAISIIYGFITDNDKCGSAYYYTDSKTSGWGWSTPENCYHLPSNSVMVYGNGIPNILL